MSQRVEDLKELEGALLAAASLATNLLPDDEIKHGVLDHIDSAISNCRYLQGDDTWSL